MKRYDFYGPESGPGIEERDDGDWVPAEVAQALYDALQKVARRIDANDCDEWTLHALKTTAFEALSLADGEAE